MMISRGLPTRLVTAGPRSGLPNTSIAKVLWVDHMGRGGGGGGGGGRGH